MARITIEDCLPFVENRFQLVILASKRARILALGGSESNVDWENDKPTVVALREIAEGKITQDYLIQENKVEVETLISEPTLPEPSLTEQLLPPTPNDETTL